MFFPKVKFDQVHVVELERKVNGGGGVPDKGIFKKKLNAVAFLLNPLRIYYQIGGYALGLGWKKSNSFNRTISEFELEKSPYRGRVHEKERIKLLGLEKDLFNAKSTPKKPTMKRKATPGRMIPKRAASIVRQTEDNLPEEIEPNIIKRCKTELLDIEELKQLEKDKKELKLIRQSRKKVGCNCKGPHSKGGECCTTNKCPCFKNEIECNEGSCGCFEHQHGCQNPLRFVFDEERVNSYRRKRIEEETKTTPNKGHDLI